MDTRTPSLALRWTTLAVVLLNIALNYFPDALGLPGRAIPDVTADYPSLFTPAGYAFSIWGVIYLGYILYVIWQVLPSQRSVGVYDRLAVPLIVQSLLGIGWLFSFRQGALTLAEVCIVGMLVTGAVIFTRVHAALTRREALAWLAVPFSLFLGWISVAVIDNTSVWLVALGWDGGLVRPETWAMLLLAVALGLGVVIGYAFADALYPLVIAWAAFAIWAARQGDAPDVATVALVAGLSALAVAAVCAFRAFRLLVERPTVGA